MTTIARFIRELVRNYATYDKVDGFFDLTLSDLPDFIAHEFSSILMSNDPAIANESICMDNPYYENLMQPALIKYLSDTTNRNNEIAFNDAWKLGLVKYHSQWLEKFINDELVDYNSDYKYEHQKEGVRAWY